MFRYETGTFQLALIRVRQARDMPGTRPHVQVKTGTFQLALIRVRQARDMPGARPHVQVRDRNI
jgi:hypothetical protein